MRDEKDIKWICQREFIFSREPVDVECVRYYCKYANKEIKISYEDTTRERYEELEAERSLDQRCLDALMPHCENCQAYM